MRARRLASLIVLSGIAGCQTPPGRRPDVAAAIVADLDAGHAPAAKERFEQAIKEDEYSDKLYPILYRAAVDRYSQGNATGSTPILRFLAAEYPHSLAVREALLYSLFLERSAQAQPDP